MKKLLLLVLAMQTVLLSAFAGGEQQNHWKIAFFSDLHVSPGNGGAENLRMLVEDVNARKDEFYAVIVAGDLTNHGGRDELDLVKSELEKLEVPYYAIPGNHETNWSDSAGLHFFKLWGDDRFFFRMGNFLIAAFNSGPYLKMGDSNVKKQDIVWVKETLRRELKENDHVLIVSHCPFTGDQGGMSNWAMVLDALDEFPVESAFFGHFHCYGVYDLGGYPGFLCRSVIMGGNIGYTIIEVDSDGLILKERVMGQENEPVLYQVDFASHKELEKLTPADRTGRQLGGVLPKNVKVEKCADYNSSIFSGPATANEVLYTADSAGVIRSQNLVSGEILWSREFPPVSYSTLLIVGDRVVVGLPAGMILGLDRFSGETVWTLETNAPVANDGLVTKDGYVLMGGGSGSFYKLNPENGQILWQFDGVEGAMQARPAYDGKHVVFGAWDQSVYCLDAEDGTLLWRWQGGRPGVLYSPGNCIPVIANHKVFIVAPDRHLTAIDLVTGKTIYRVNHARFRESFGSSPDGEVVYAKTMDGMIVAAETAPDVYTEKWQSDTKMGYEHSPSPVIQLGDTVFAASRLGTLYALNAEDGAVLWSYNCGNSQVNQFAWDDLGKGFYFTLVEGSVFRVSLPEE